MVVPYDLKDSSTISKSKQTRHNSRTKVSKRKILNDKPQRVSIRQANNRVQKRTHDIDRSVDDIGKENHPNNGFTQLVQTKMMDAKTRDGKHTNNKVNKSTDKKSSSPVSRKRQRTSEFTNTILFSFHRLSFLDDDDDNSIDIVPTTTETGKQCLC